MRDRELEAVALGPRAGHLGMRLRAVGRGVEVGAAREDQRVEPVEQPVRRHRDRVVGRHDERDAPVSCTACTYVARRHRHGRVPGAPAHLLDGGADADDGLLTTAGAHSRSKPRKRSQSVTAASYASISIRARFR